MRAPGYLPSCSKRSQPARWLTERRVTAIATMTLLATILSLAVLFAGAHGTLDAAGRPLGTDFSNVWTAGWMADHGRAALAWDWPAHHAVQVATHHDPAVPFYGWHYPPPFLLVAALLATLPYVPALIVWQTRDAGARAAAGAADRAGATHDCWSRSPRRWCSSASATAITASSARLLGGGLLLLDRRPFLAGLLIGCLVYKPQFAVLLPLVLLAGGHWRAIGGAAFGRPAVPARRWRSGAGRCGRRSSNRSRSPAPS